MITFMTLAGLIIAVAFFLYTLSVLDAGKRRTADAGSPKGAPKSKTDVPAGPRDVSDGTQYRDFSESVKEMMPGRRCPLCMKTLTRDEPLYASFVDTTSGRKVLIYGCQYCYKEDTAKKRELREEAAAEDSRPQ